MIIEIDIHFLMRNRITAHQYVILKLIDENKHSLLLGYLRDTDTHKDLASDWQQLYDLGLVNSAPDGLVNVNNLKVTSKFTRDTSFNADPFDELYKAYPVKALRKDGTFDYLRVDQKRCRKIYNNIVVNNPNKHKFILKALEMEVAQRDAQGSMAFMKRMPTWLTSEAWSTFTDVIEDDYNTTHGENKVAYGTSFE